MRICYLGNFSAPHHTEVHIAEAFEVLGHEVQRLQECDVGLHDIDSAVDGARLLLWTRTAQALRVPPGRMLAWLTRQHARGLVTASYHPDLFAGLSRGVGVAEDPFWRTQHSFSADGGSPEFFRSRGVNHHWLRAGVGARDAVVGAAMPEFVTDVVFVGSGAASGGGYHREWTYRQELLGFLADTYSDKFVKHGHPPHNGGRAKIRGHDLSRLYASARVVVGDSLCLGPEDRQTPRFTHEQCWSNRVYQTLGRGGVLVHPRISGMELEFQDREHLLFYDFGDLAGLRRVIDDALADQVLRARLRVAGRARVLERCLYQHRMAELLAVVGLGNQ